MGETFYSLSYAYLENVNFSSLVSEPSCSVPTLVHQSPSGDKRSLLYINRFVQFFCPAGSNVKSITKSQSGSSIMKSSSILDLLVLYCVNCPSNKYSFESGSTVISGDGQERNRTSVACKNCPPGGNCSFNIKALDNYWGYKYGKPPQASFTTCPTGYCCEGQLCKAINSCAKGREGTICGLCKDGYTEVLFSSDCIPNSECNYVFFWIIFGSVGLFYTVILLSLRDIFNIAKQLLFPEVYYSWYKYLNTLKPFVNSTLIQPLINKELDDYAGDQDCPGIHHGEQHTEEIDKQKEEESHFFAGLMKIFIFFYQAVIYIKVYDKQHHPQNFSASTKELILMLFNLKTSLPYKSIVMCPFVGLRPVTKRVFTSFFVFNPLFNIALIYITVTVVGKYLQGTSLHGVFNKFHKKLSIRLSRASVLMLLLGYSEITLATFSLLGCVPIKGMGDHLYIDASIKCYMPWQYVVFFILFAWVIPFCFVPAFLPKMLNDGRITLPQFFLAVVFPLLGAFSWCFKKKKPVQTVINKSSLSNEIVAVFQGPFRCIDEKHNYHYWETILTGRRLIIIFIYTILIHPILRSFIVTIFVLLCIIHHIKTFPFKNISLNYLETFYLVLLELLSVIGIFRITTNQLPIESAGIFSSLEKIFDITETVFLLIAPIFTLVVISILIIGRVLSLLAGPLSKTIHWLCRSR